MASENVNIIQGIYDAFAKGDIPTVLGALDPHVEWREADNIAYADGNPYIGPNAVLQGIFMRLGTEWENFVVQPVEILDAEGTVVTLGIYSGIYKATSKSLRAQMVHVWKLAAGKVVKFQQYTDTKQFADVMIA